MKLIFSIIILSFLSNCIYAQVNCAKNLNDARSDYTNGNLYAIPGKLTDCLNDGFSKEEKVEAYKLLALTYYNINQQDKARESLIKLLKLKTDYVVVKNVDPDELYSLYSKINTRPVYYLGAGIGANFTFPFLRDSTYRRTTNSVIGGEDYSYSSATAISANIQFIYPVKNFLHAKASLGYDLHKYNYDQTTIVRDGDDENKTNTKYTDTNVGINLGLYARFMSDEKLTTFYKPFIEIGVLNRLNVNSEIDEYIETNTRNSRNSEPFTPDKINMNDYRRTFNLGYSVQLGSMIKIQEYFGEVSIGVTYFSIIETEYEDNLRESLYSVASEKTVVEDLYHKIILNCTFSFNIPFYNFK